MEETCSTEYERISSRPSIPLSASSIGIVISSSTSTAEFPTASVCTSTIGGANSGKTSSGASRVTKNPNTRVAAAPKIASHRKRRLRATIQRITRSRSGSWVLVEDLELGGQELRRPNGHHDRARRRAVRKECRSEEHTS